MERYLLLSKAWTGTAKAGHFWNQRDLADSIPEAEVIIRTFINRIAKYLESHPTPPPDMVATVSIDVWKVDQEEQQMQSMFD